MDFELREFTKRKFLYNPEKENTGYQINICGEAQIGKIQNIAVVFFKDGYKHTVAFSKKETLTESKEQLV